MGGKGRTRCGRNIVGEEKSVDGLDEGGPLARCHDRKCPLQQFNRQHIAVPLEELASGRRQPHLSAAPVGGIVLPLEQARALKVRDYVAHY